MIRYEILTKPGLILDATLIRKVATAKPRTTPTIIAYVATNDQKAFEKQIESNSQVLGYHCDPRAPGIVPTVWSRP